MQVIEKSSETRFMKPQPGFPLPRLLLGVLFICGHLHFSLGAGAIENRSAIYPDRPPGMSSARPIGLRSGPHLFLDDYLISESTNIKRTVNSPRRDPLIPNPLVTGKEDHCRANFFTVIRDPATGRFRLWYKAFADAKTRQMDRSDIAYMESEDGVHWLRPYRILTPPKGFLGATDGNVCDEGPQAADPSRRFKTGWCIWKSPGEESPGRSPEQLSPGMRIGTSPDGLTWAPLTTEVVFDNGHDINVLYFDPIRRRYCAFSCINAKGEKWSFARTIVQRTSADLIHWSPPWHVMTPDHSREHKRTQNYGMDAFLARGDLWIGMVKILRDDLKADDPPDPPNAQGIGYTSLIWSRDGASWTRDAEVFLDRAIQPGTWDHAMSWISEQVVVGDEVYLYYGGYARGHKVNMYEERQIGLLKMKRDRYVAREAGQTEGRLRTPLLITDADEMTLNLETKKGAVRIQVLDAANRPIPGFAFDDCVIPIGDGVDLPVKWRGSLGTLRNRPIQLEFSLREAKLFAFDLINRR